MLTKKENFLEMKNGGHPDRFVNQYEPFSIVMGDPIGAYIRGKRTPGMEPIKDRFGVTIIWPEGQVAAIPDHGPGKTVLEDVTEWRDTVVIPDISICRDNPAWEEYLERARQVDRNDTFLTGAMFTGVFEQVHALMGFENALADMLMEPEDMLELCEAIGEYRLEYLKLYVEKVHPDAMLFHDDWGASNNLFMSPDTWRELFMPQHKKLFDFCHANDILVIHHADSFLEPIVSDMADIGIDVWQGVLPENDISRLQEELNGRMVLMGGIGALVDVPDADEEIIRRETRKACMTYGTKGYFIPCLTYGTPGSLFPNVYDIISDEIDRCSKEVF